MAFSNPTRMYEYNNELAKMYAIQKYKTLNAVKTEKFR